MEELFTLMVDQIRRAGCETGHIDGVKRTESRLRRPGVGACSNR
jgi:hypothetical protein